MSPPIDHRAIGILGIVTICSYGTWYYSFGVLLDPIRLEEGWSESTLAASFSAGTALIGLTSLLGGRLLDRIGHRRVLLLAAAIGPGALFTATLASNVWLFFAAVALASGAMGSLAFYPVTMTTAVRLNPSEPSRAIAVLTIWGAVASAIYLPFTSRLVETLEWRSTVRILAVIAAVVFASAAALLPDAPPAETREPPPIRDMFRSSVESRQKRLFTVAVAFGGIAMSTMLVYQVPTMTALGLPAGTAATVAGLRGFSQLGGRIPLTGIMARLGNDGALLLAFVAMGIGGALLAFSGTLPVAVVFALVAGFGMGAFSPLQGIMSEELFDRRTLGAMMGFYGSVLLLAGSVGPVLAGVLAETTGDRRWAPAVVVAATVVAAGAQALARRESR